MVIFWYVTNFDHWKDLQAEKRSNIEMIDQLNSKITILTGEVKLLQSDKETDEQSLQFHVFIYGP